MKGFRPKFLQNAAQKMRREKIPIFIAILTQHQEITTNLMEFVIHALLQNGKPECRFAYEYVLVENHRPVEYARNLAVRKFMEVSKDKPNARLWFIDADMAPPQNYEEQLSLDADLGAGRAYGILGHNLFGCIQKLNEGVLMHLAIAPDAKAVIDVDGSGTGGLWIHRRVLADPRLHINEQGDCFRTLYENDGRVKLSEDLDFTGRASALGYKIKAHLGAKWSHYKKVDLLAMEGKAASFQMERDIQAAKAASEHTPVQVEDVPA